jgi:hypothetical protein
MYCTPEREFTALFNARSRSNPTPEIHLLTTAPHAKKEKVGSSVPDIVAKGHVRAPLFTPLPLPSFIAVS